ncbi:hypothetical protein [Kocuria sp.]|nr:hypothetical protein [Kocuria sp.]MDO5618998.1 hypothetical protein [Kocuria sp.]
MSHLSPEPHPGFQPVFWHAPQPGTNGYVSTWGEQQAGSPPSVTNA